MLDEKFRRRVGALARSDEGGLDDEARARILRRVAEEGPSLAHRARRIRVITAVVAPVLAAAAVAAFFIGRRTESVEPAVAVVAPKPPACAARAVSGHADRGFVRGETGQTLDLGRTAFARASADSNVRLVDASPCRTVVELSSGTVTVHAKDLGGGELAVRTHAGEVSVHGTIFAVTETGDSLSVEVVEGKVLVTHGAAKAEVSAGERLLSSELGVARGSLGPDRTRELRAAVSAPEVLGFDSLRPVDSPKEARKTNAPAAQARTKPEVEALDLASSDSDDTDLLAQAEEARRGQDYVRARDLYRKAAEASGATGEAALVALARMELGLGRSSAALDATRRRRERFGQGTLGPEALWIDVRSYRVAGEQERARAIAQELVRTWPSSPQARAADQWLSSGR